MSIERDKVIFSEKVALSLWGFNIVIMDRRDGTLTPAYIIVAGNDDCELEYAEREIRERVSRLGYELQDCEYDQERIYDYDAAAIFRTARQGSGEKPERHALDTICDEDESTALMAALGELE